jgi:hypothetical protein
LCGLLTIVQYSPEVPATLGNDPDLDCGAGKILRSL